MSDGRSRAGGGPLTGIRILDLTSVQMGPLAATILADLGADVIKVEAPSGDIARQSSPSRSPGMGHSFLAINRNKRSIALDLKHPEGRDALLALAKRADALMYNVRPQAMQRLRLGYEDVSAVNPRIVYVGAMGFSERGRYRGRPAFDLVIQGMAGIPGIMARASGQQPRYAPFSYADQTAALHVVIAVVSALFHARATGRGQRVDVPMFENIVHVLLGEHMAGGMFIPPLGPVGYARQLSPDRRPYPTKDGYICPFLYNDKQWRTFFQVIGQAERFDNDPRFASHSSRTKNIDAVFGLMAEVMRTRTTAEWMQLFAEHDLPVGAMNSLDDVVNDPHLADIGYFQQFDHPTEGSLRTTCYPTEFSLTPTANRRHAPRLGEHTAEILAEAGCDGARIRELMDKRAAFGPPSDR